MRGGPQAPWLAAAKVAVGCPQASAWPSPPISYQEELYDFPACGKWRARSQGSAEASQWPAPAAAPAAHSPHLSLGGKFFQG
ncbi:nuclear protein 2 isoform X3 [Pan troglodytes]|uniref:nuclear protein 2 isoform X3 n=1 Tax=Pan troglodytes TaxID=9598 RepID=UPI0030133A28